MALRTVSVLRPSWELSPDYIEGLFQRTIAKLVEVSTKELHKDVTVRDLTYDKLPGSTVDDPVETSGGSDNAFAVTTVGNGGAIADETFIAMLGVGWGGVVAEDASDNIIGAFRFTVGGSRLALWSIHKIVPKMGVGTQTGDMVYYPLAGYAMTPIVITQNQTLTIDEYVMTVTTAYRPVWVGLIAEPVGRTINV